MSSGVLDRLTAFVDELPLAVVLGVCVAAMAVVGTVDLLTSGDVVLSIFYAAPIALAAWAIGRLAGIVFAVLATALWTIGDVSGLDQSWSQPVVWWNFGVRLAFFVIVVVILVALRRALAQERLLARVDPLTQAANARRFGEEAEFELRRARRTGSALSLAAFDVDNLKTVNDRHGHAAGDALLVAVASAWMKALRGTDTVARVGGDEFAVLMPDTDDAEARIALQKGRAAALAAIADGGWASTLSLGVVTCLGGDAAVDDLLREADRLMYEVKSAGKDGVRAGPAGNHSAHVSGSGDPGTSRMEDT